MQLVHVSTTQSRIDGVQTQKNQHQDNRIGASPFWASFLYCHHAQNSPIGHSPVEKGTDVPASQTSPSMKDLTVKVLASDALVITR